MLITILLEQRSLNIAVAVLGLLATLFGYHSLLGQPTGVLRRLLYAAPYAVGCGGLILLLDVFAGERYSHLAARVIGQPVSSATMAVAVAVYGFGFALVRSGVGFRYLSFGQRIREAAGSDAVGEVASQTLGANLEADAIPTSRKDFNIYLIYSLLASGKFGKILEGIVMFLAQVTNLGLGILITALLLIFQFSLVSPNRPILIGASFALSVGFMVMGLALTATAFNPPAGVKGPACLLSCLLAVPLIPIGLAYRVGQLYALISVLVYVGWKYALLLLALYCLFAVAFGIIFWLAAHLREKGLGAISLVCALAAAGIVLYEALVF